MVDNIIEIKDLVKRYDKADSNAVDGVSFNVKRGEFFALLGPNGAGKTTTLSVLTTILSKTSGQVEVDGFDIEKNSSEIRKRIGVIFQNPSLDINLTAEENVRFHAILYGLFPFRPTFASMPDVYKKRVMELSGVLEIEKAIFDPVKSFSGGMKRKLEIIRSLMHNPKILYLDEPTSGLDPASRRRLWEYLGKVRETEKTTMFLTTHYLEEAEDADRVAIISRGKIISFGTPGKIKRDLVHEYLIVDANKRADLKKQLKDMKVDFVENQRIKIDISENNTQEILKKIEVPLSYIDIQKPTLEEAYLKITKGKEKKR
ncbi:MAG: ABC transporter ATP-binding protein [Candidatus Woesebacteria bacterium]|jgi:ABC-2 type transport system ATP-binding protein